MKRLVYDYAEIRRRMTNIWIPPNPKDKPNEEEVLWQAYASLIGNPAFNSKQNPKAWIDFSKQVCKRATGICLNDVHHQCLVARKCLMK